ncbi:MAG: single-stranded DNA-binding protein [Bacteroidia bacterium]|nr:single-stranded DNA-binding protein [Bacteroidia bacterium]
MNKVILIGNITKNPELKKTNTGKSVVSNSIATNKFYKDQQGQRQQIVNFTNIVLFGRQAEVFAEHLTKGSKIGVIGELRTRDYESNGVKKYVTEVIVNELEFLSSKNDNQNNQGEYSQPEPKTDYSQPSADNEPEIRVEDIPF